MLTPIIGRFRRGHKLQAQPFNKQRRDVELWVSIPDAKCVLCSSWQLFLGVWGRVSIRPKPRSTPPSKPEITLSSRVKGQSFGTARPRDLILAHDGCNLQQKAFHLADVGGTSFLRGST